MEILHQLFGLPGVELEVVLLASVCKVLNELSVGSVSLNTEYCTGICPQIHLVHIVCSVLLFFNVFEYNSLYSILSFSQMIPTSHCYFCVLLQGINKGASYLFFSYQQCVFQQ